MRGALTAKVRKVHQTYYLPSMTPIASIYAAMRGQSLEDFQKTRNARVLYSVAGGDAGKTDWDRPGKH